MAISRVRYRERQYLRRQDLGDEQSYRLAMSRRHQLGPHGWGIVAGLNLLTEEGTLQIGAGTAVDGYGRSLVLTSTISVGPEMLDRPALGGATNSRLLDVWLLYGRSPENVAEGGRWPCGPGQHNRWHEKVRIRLELAQPAAPPIDPRRPEAVANADRQFGPHHTPPDNPASQWPIYLGRIRRDSSGVTTVPSSRPYATLFGNKVVAPSGKARLLVENEITGARRLLAVSTAEEPGQWQDRLVVERRGDTAVYGHMTLYDDLLIEGLQLEALASVPEEPKLWQLYHTAVLPEGQKTPIHQLRLEIVHPGAEGDPQRYKLAVGSEESVENKFIPTILVRADGSVIIRGNLDLDGELVEGPIGANPNDPRFTSALLDNWLGGISSAASTVDAHYSNPLEVSLNVTDTTPPPGGSTSYTLPIRNTGQTELRDFIITQIVAVEGQAPRQENIPIDSGTVLAAGATFDPTIEHDLLNVPGTEDQKVTLLVTVIATGPDGGQVQATVTEILTITISP